MEHFDRISRIDKIATASVLVVEDDYLIRMNAADIIEEAGFPVETTSDADQALRILGARRSIGVVFTDVHMPGSLNGLELARLIGARWPAVGVIVTSGRATRIDIPAGALFIAKPYSSSQLVGKIHTLLEELADVH